MKQFEDDGSLMFWCGFPIQINGKKSGNKLRNASF
jgi:hypothetical protein